MAGSGITGTFDLQALGERLRTARVTQSLTLDDLAARTGVSRSMISAIEKGGKVPTIVVLHHLAAGLSLRMTDLMGEPQPDRVVVIRSGEQSRVTDPSGWERRNLAPAIPGLHFEFMRTTIPAGVDAGVFPSHRPGSREHVVVSEGSLTLIIDGQPFDLRTGDAISYAGDCEHQFISQGSTDCVYYLALVE
jgi:transcriptional regulator with XRE-family HTH domain